MLPPVAALARLPPVAPAAVDAEPPEPPEPAMCPVLEKPPVDPSGGGLVSMQATAIASVAGMSKQGR